MNELGKLNELDLRSEWAQEPKFSDWLAEHLDELGSAIGVDLVAERREADVGDFSLDILAHEDGGERRVVIENQLEETNHDHLGKIITYAAGYQAKILIWVVKEARDEHRAAVKWLNENSSDDVGVFLVKVVLYKIGTSRPAPLFSVLESPNGWVRETQALSGEVTQVQKDRRSFWTGFMNYAMSREDFRAAFNRRKPSTDHWMTLAAGSADYQISLTITKSDHLGVAIYIPDNKDLYHAFEAHRTEIETELGFKLGWQELPEKKASRIQVIKQITWSDENKADECYAWLVTTSIAIKRTFTKYC